MRTRTIVGLILSALIILISVAVGIYTYYYYTTNRVGPVGDGQFHFSSIRPLVFSCASGVLLLVSCSIRAYKELSSKGRK